MKNFYNTETPYHLRESQHFLNLAIYEIKTAIQNVSRSIEKMNKFESEFKDESIDYLETLKSRLEKVLEQTKRTEHLLMETWYDQEPPV